MQPGEIRSIAPRTCTCGRTVRKPIREHYLLWLRFLLPVKIDRLVLGNLENPRRQFGAPTVLEGMDARADGKKRLAGKFFGVGFRDTHDAVQKSDQASCQLLVKLLQRPRGAALKRPEKFGRIEIVMNRSYPIPYGLTKRRYTSIAQTFLAALGLNMYCLRDGDARHYATQRRLLSAET
jgi:hypothetical protein